MGTEHVRGLGTSAAGVGIDCGEGVGDRLNDYAKVAESKVRDTVDQARPTVSVLAEAVQSTLEKAGGSVRRAVDHARDKTATYREHGWGRVQGDVVEYTRSQPLVALGVAAAIGLLLGWVSSNVRAGGGSRAVNGEVPDSGGHAPGPAA